MADNRAESRDVVAGTTPDRDHHDEPIRLGIIGTGGIGSLHANLAATVADIDLVAVASLDDHAEAFAVGLGVELFREYRALADLNPDAVVIATPNQSHLEIGRFFAEHGADLLVEKPIADTRAAGAELCDVAEANDVALLVGHHRRHHSLVRATQEFVQSQLGRLIATNTMVTMRKPDSYYDIEWRRQLGAGPLLVNLIHEVDLLSTVCGEITHVQAASAKIGRNFEFDDSAAILLRYASGALGTLVISESSTSPWSWEASVSDGMGFHNAGQDHGKFVGTDASLSFPSLTTWRYDETEPDPGWQSPLHSARLNPERNNPYIAQLEHLVRVVRRTEEPLVTGRDGLRSLAVVDAVIESAANGTLVEVDALLAAT